LDIVSCTSVNEVTLIDLEAQKFAGLPQEMEIQNAKTAKIVNQIVRDSIKKVRADWNQVKDEILLEALLAKFTQHQDAKASLLETGHSNLVYHCNDNYLGDAMQGHGMLPI
jgi:ribA/ribD-fused uncharacterized protein